MKHLYRRSPWLALVSVLLIACLASVSCMAAGGAAASLSDYDPGALLGSVVGLAALGSVLVPGAAPSVEEALEAVENKTLTMGQRLDVAYKALKGVDPTGQLATVKADLTTAQAAVTAKDAELETLRARVAELEKQVAAREADVAAADEARAKAEARSVELESREQDLDKRAKALSGERMREIGFKAENLPVTTPKDPKETAYESALEAFRNAATAEEKAKAHAKLTELERVA